MKSHPSVTTLVSEEADEATRELRDRPLAAFPPCHRGQGDAEAGGA